MARDKKQETAEKRPYIRITPELGALAAKLYFDGVNLQTGLKKLKQNEVGKMTGLTTRHSVHNAIELAIQAGLVRFEVISKSNRDIERECNLFTELVNENGEPLLDLAVTRVIKPHVENGPKEFHRWEIGQVAADLLSDLINDMATRKEVVIGVSCGSTLKEMADATHAIDKPEHNIHIVPTVGSFGTIPVQEESTTIARKISERLGTWDNIHSYALPAPGFAKGGETWDELRKIPILKKVENYWKKADVLISGIGAMETNATALRLWELAGVTEDDMNLLKDHADAAGDVTLNFLANDGTPLDDKRVGNKVDKNVRRSLMKLAFPLATSLPDLANAQFSIAVGIGPEKAPAFVAAIRGKYIKGIITDLVTSDAIVEHWRNTGTDKPKQSTAELSKSHKQRMLRILQHRKKEYEDNLKEVNDWLAALNQSSPIG